MKRKMLMGLFLGFLVFGSPLFAELIDFRDSAWSGAHGEQSFTVDTVTVTCNPYGDLSNEAVLYWDPVDGFGVTSPYDPPVPSPDAEADEIDANGELFHVVFDSPTLVYGVRVADLYAKFPPETRSAEWVDWPTGGGGDGSGYGPAYGEAGVLWPDTSDQIEFYGQDSDQANGEQYVPVNRVVSFLSFDVKCTNDDYSVIGIDVVPVPAAFLLGILGLGCAGWRLRKLTA